MSTEDAGKKEIIDGLLQDAKDEAERIEAKAEKACADRIASCEIECSVIAEKAEKQAAEQVAAIRKIAESTASVTKRRQGLKTRDAVIAEVMRRVEKRLSSMVNDPAYVDILVGWIAEAAIGLDSDAAEVRASAPESKLLDEAITAAMVVIQDLVGRRVELARSQQPPLTAQGVVLTEEGGATAFNNQVATRFTRYQTEIRKLIHDRLFSAN